jgi:hypothetical protein
MSDMQEEMTFDEAIDRFRESCIQGGWGSPEHMEALNTISYLWDYDRVGEINMAIAPTYARPIPPANDRVFILMSIRSNTYCILGRNQMAQWI